MSDAAFSPEDAILARIAAEVSAEPSLVACALRWLDEGVPPPFLARYRREAVGGLDEGTLRRIRRAAESARELERRREFILRAVEERGTLTDKLRRRIERCSDPVELEYLYEPHRPPRKTPASLARAQGLSPLADALLAGATDPLALAREHVDPEKEIASAEQALQGARDILAERFASDAEVRLAMLRSALKEGVLEATPPPGKDEIPERYRRLRGYRERLAKTPAHRYLSIRRAMKEGAAGCTLEAPDEKTRAAIARRYFPKEPPEAVREILAGAVDDALRLARRGVIADAHRLTKERADEETVRVLADNLADMLLFPPAGDRRILGVDPAARGAITLACLDEKGQPLDHARVKPFDKNEAKASAAREKLLDLVRAHEPALVALGNGTGRQPCEAWLQQALEPLGDAMPPIVIVNESGVHAYANAPAARAELPALPVQAIAAVSIARRLRDPLAELVKLDPRQMLLGPQQGDVDQARLARRLHEVVESCVSRVGADLNRASAAHLAAVCGLDAHSARAVVERREKEGPYRTREAVAGTPGVSAQAYTWSAGFLRVHGGENPVDATGVHPESMPLVARIAAALGKTPGDLVGDAETLSGVVAEDFVDETHGPASVAGVLLELIEAGADPRERLQIAARPAGVRSPDDLRPGMRLPGRVTNVTSFGAFVDLGVRQDGLVHVSELADRFVKDPTSVVRVGEVVEVRVLGVDPDTKRISLSMKSGRPPAPRREKPPRRRQAARRGRPERESEPGGGEPRVLEPEPAPEPAAAAEGADPVPADMSEEEFMQRKLEELRRRFS